MLDAVAPGIAATVERAGRFAVGFPRDDWVNAAQVEIRSKVVGVVSLVGKQFARAGLAKCDQVLGQSRSRRSS
jgi:hypothetical protein